MKAIIKWRNRYSGEEGYVGRTSTKNQCFYNSATREGAKLYADEKAARKVINTIKDLGEGRNNDYEVIVV